ncbi:hypothetical protein K504DRAFT_420657 [Pleomassaria siparia CBS 279.74]|uniref:Uncharacterized protein n=1 Tax=Pleomassaria siparia CBS 279.74 TaxID=1314801 RepID=A0A6G1KPV4_9PLEO|nr:hypothetical protein K504DRAFT_420657 [Pleomassaria siparia CBS 279.74]
MTATAHLIKTVFIKFRHSFRAPTIPTSETAEVVKEKYITAVVAYVNGLSKNGAKPLTTAFLEQILKENDGDFLHMCAKLVDENFIALEKLDEVVGVCKAVNSSIPKEDVKKKVAASPKSIHRDPIDGMNAWPTQEKRTNIVGSRTCVLKGVAGITSINQLQALVWGGRLESISLPPPGTSHAVVKFLTAEGCDKFFEATANGIKVNGDEKVVIQVDKTEGPNSSNDLIRNCSEGDASRCVRAFDADEDWARATLERLAVGKSKPNPRVVDIIKRGKTAKGRFYIEFRFSHIVHALQFKRELEQDEEWEPCTIVYAKDPCETARGVHYKDEDETATGFL